MDGQEIWVMDGQPLECVGNSCTLVKFCQEILRIPSGSTRETSVEVIRDTLYKNDHFWIFFRQDIVFIIGYINHTSHRSYTYF